jgi:signal transduction histidine kinase
MEPLRIDSTLTGMRSLLSRLAGPHIDLVIECEAELPPVRFDSVAFRRIVVDLVRNAADAIPDSGRIAVRAAAQREHVVLTVADTGPGDLLRELPRADEPFHATKPRAAGTEVRDLVLAHGAAIRVASTPGGGSKFEIYLPVVA